MGRVGRYDVYEMGGRKVKSNVSYGTAKKALRELSEKGTAAYMQTAAK